MAAKTKGKRRETHRARAWDGCMSPLKSLVRRHRRRPTEIEKVRSHFPKMQALGVGGVPM